MKNEPKAWFVRLPTGETLGPWWTKTSAYFWLGEHDATMHALYEGEQIMDPDKECIKGDPHNDSP